MNYLHKPQLTPFLRYAVDIILLLNLLTLLLLPWLLNMVYDNPNLLNQLEPADNPDGPEITIYDEYPSDLPPSSYPFYLTFLYLSGFSTAWILVQGHRILLRLERGQTFSAGQNISFRHIAMALFLLSIVFFVKIFVYNTLLTMFCSVMFFLFALISLVMADIFHQAWQVKTENELTI